MESITHWFQDWSEACEYANECAPDLSFIGPYSALVSIAAVCFVIWWRNERRISQSHSSERHVLAEGKVTPVLSSQLSPTLQKMRTAPAEPRKQAA